MPMPMATMAGTRRQDQEVVSRMITPTPTHMAATMSRKPGLDGLRPTCTGSSGLGRLGGLALLFGVARPRDPGFLRRSGITHKRTGGSHADESSI
jgi:hypothetical protein